MDTSELVQFSSSADPDVLKTLRRIAASEKREFHSILDEAFRDFIAKKELPRQNRQLMKSFTESLNEFKDLYKKLA